MEELSTTSILSLLDTNKAQRESFVNDVIEKMESGAVNPLKIHCQVKSMETLIKGFTDKKSNPLTAERYSSLVLEAAENMGGKSFEFYNGKFQIKEAGTVYDWSKCEDTELVDLLEQQEKLKEAIKAKQDFLKTVPLSGLGITNTETGETYTVYPPSKTSTTIVSISIK
jgi:hypothetical protein